MNPLFDVAVIGATGLVGELLVELLDERDFPVGTLHVLAEGEAVGHSVPFKGKNLRVRDTASFDFSQVRLVFFAEDPALAQAYAERAGAAGCSLIDLSAGLDAALASPLVAEANGERLAALAAPYRLRNPCAPAILLSAVLAPLRDSLSIRRLTLTACLAVSSRGREGVSELARQTAELLNVRPLEPRLFGRQMAFNLLAEVDDADPAGHGQLERRLHDELRVLLNAPDLEIAVTCIQVPVFFGDSLSVSLLAESPVDLPAIRAALDAADGIERVEEGDYPTVVGDAVGQDAIYVGRLRGGFTDPRELNLWIASDNVRKGAALNAVQSAELLIKHYL
ncbi:aspartate-semialdehyde dehydrogenase [Pseudomonas alcaligenes]|uniref:aspartate-semialdehyde dehydrogenase n=1 Tax=Pseudomonas sp. RIT-PI-AD TaxID=3035294 RepID=UPI0021D85107